MECLIKIFESADQDYAVNEARKFINERLAKGLTLVSVSCAHSVQHEKYLGEYQAWVVTVTMLEEKR